MLKRHEVEILLRAGHRKTEVARLTGVSLCSVKRIAQEGPVVHVDEAAERAKRQIGRPSAVANFRKQVVEILQEKPDLASLEILRRARSGISGRQDSAVRAGSLASPKAGEAAGSFRRTPRRVQSARFWASGSGVRQWHQPADSFFCLASEVLAIHARQYSQGRDGGKFGADPGRTSGQLGWSSFAVCV